MHETTTLTSPVEIHPGENLENVSAAQTYCEGLSETSRLYVMNISL